MYHRGVSSMSSDATEDRYKGAGVFNGPFDDRLPKNILDRKKTTMQEAIDWVLAHNDRWRVVAVCPHCEEDLIQEELTAHRHKHLNARARVVARMFDDLPTDAKSQVIAYISETA